MCLQVGSRTRIGDWAGAKLRDSIGPGTLTDQNTLQGIWVREFGSENLGIRNCQARVLNVWCGFGLLGARDRIGAVWNVGHDLHVTAWEDKGLDRDHEFRVWEGWLDGGVSGEGLAG
jgi:hypothetical protein